MRALIIEDDAILCGSLSRHLEQHGFVVDTAADGEEGLYKATEFPLDIAIIDLGLPGLSGIEIIKKVRETLNYPILILTARDLWQDKVEGLEAGGDDYLVKPFHIEELLARLRVLLRRQGGWTQNRIECGPIHLLQSAQEVILHGDSIELTSYEFRVLEYLMLNAGKVISKSELSEHIYAEENDRDSNVIEVFIRRLRKKLDPNKTLNPIETLRGSGYRLILEKADLRKS